MYKFFPLYLQNLQTLTHVKCDSGFRHGKLGAIELDQSGKNSQRNVKNNKDSNESLIVLTCWSRTLCPPQLLANFIGSYWA